MSRVRARAIPWLLLACFLVAAFTLFSLAAGNDAVRLNGVLSLSVLWRGDGVAEVRQAVSRKAAVEEGGPPWLREPDADAADEGAAVDALASAKERPEKRERATASKPPQQPAGASGPRIESQRFRETSATFKAMFRTNSKPGEALVYFRRNPARWVVDLQGKWDNVSGRIVELPGRFIHRVSLEPRGEFLRILFVCVDQNAMAGPPPKLEREAKGFTVTIPCPSQGARSGNDSEQGAAESSTQ